MGLNIQSSAEALFIAIEMEKRAVRMYERMLLLFDRQDTLLILRRLLSDEVSHLKRFQAMMGKDTLPGEEALLLSAEASGILFPGGLTEALRHGADASAEALLRFAASQEQIATETYLSFAAACTGSARSAFEEIAAEEGQHLVALQEMQPH